MQNGQRIRIYNASGGHNDESIEKTGLIRSAADNSFSGNNTFSGSNAFNGSNSFAAGQTQSFNGPVVFGAASNQILYRDTEITFTNIVGSAAGDIGHAAGVSLVPAPGAGYILHFISATLVYDFAVAAYSAGGDDLHILYPGFATITGVIAAADMLGSAGDEIAAFYPLTAAALSIPTNVGISIAGTAYTDPGGTARGVLRVRTRYTIEATGL